MRFEWTAMSSRSQRSRRTDMEANLRSSKRLEMPLGLSSSCNSWNREATSAASSSGNATPSPVRPCFKAFRREWSRLLSLPLLRNILDRENAGCLRETHGKLDGAEDRHEYTRLPVRLR